MYFLGGFAYGVGAAFFFFQMLLEEVHIVDGILKAIFWPEVLLLRLLKRIF